MNIYADSDSQILEALGQQIKQLRLNRNITQQALSTSLALSLNTLKALEIGRGKLATFVAVLRELNALDKLQTLLTDAPISPLQLAKLRGKSRLRASGKRKKMQAAEKLPW